MHFTIVGLFLLFHGLSAGILMSVRSIDTFCDYREAAALLVCFLIVVNASIKFVVFMVTGEDFKKELCNNTQNQPDYV